MDYQFEISKRLSREHLEVVALLNRVEKFLRSHGLEHQPDWRGAEVRRILSELRGALRTEIPNHFAIEELELFPLYAQEGGAEMVELLLADHQIILDLAREIQPLVEKALGHPEDMAQLDWETLRAQGNAFITELCAHADKEEFGFVPTMDELLDPVTAVQIIERYRLMS